MVISQSAQIVPGHPHPSLMLVDADKASSGFSSSPRSDPTCLQAPHRHPGCTRAVSLRAAGKRPAVTRILRVAQSLPDRLERHLVAGIETRGVLRAGVAPNSCSSLVEAPGNETVYTESQPGRTIDGLADSQGCLVSEALPPTLVPGITGSENRMSGGRASQQCREAIASPEWPSGSKALDQPLLVRFLQGSRFQTRWRESG